LTQIINDVIFFRWQPGELHYKNIKQYNYRKTYRGAKDNGSGRFLSALAAFILSIFKILFWLKGLLVGFIVFFYYKIIRRFLRFFFYKVLVKLYSGYLYLGKKMGFDRARIKFPLVLNQKMTHILVVVMTILLLFVNISSKSNASASGYHDRANRTILADLVIGELGGFIEDEQLIVETFDQEAIISITQQSYLDNLSGFRPQAKTSYKDDELEDDYASTVKEDGTLVRPNIASTNITEQDRTETVSYTVLPGDTISTIAEKFKISVSTILWENNLNAYSIIRPNDTLSILPVSGLNHKVAKNETLSSIAKKYEVEEEKILAINKNLDSGALQIGQTILVPGGKKSTYVAPAPKTYTGIDAIKNIVTPPASKVESGNKMAWPTEGHRITQYYSWRHYGLDIANKVGTPLYAADSGTIELAGWGTGYGNQIVIDHGGGKKTRYAHLSKFYVGAGDKVSKGDSIGAMGSTGWSTGSHLHFEVIIDGKKYNPLNYIK
jgi:murein DD-endopeptidase MepM/ murein hydrolase activator NlpD